MINEIMTGLLIASGLYIMYEYVKRQDWTGNGGGRKIIAKYK